MPTKPKENKDSSQENNSAADIIKKRSFAIREIMRGLQHDPNASNVSVAKTYVDETLATVRQLNSLMVRMCDRMDSTINKLSEGRTAREMREDAGDLGNLALTALKLDLDGESDVLSSAAVSVPRVAYSAGEDEERQWSRRFVITTLTILNAKISANLEFASGILDETEKVAEGIEVLQSILRSKNSPSN